MEAGGTGKEGLGGRFQEEKPLDGLGSLGGNMSCSGHPGKEALGGSFVCLPGRVAPAVVFQSSLRCADSGLVAPGTRGVSVRQEG